MAFLKLISALALPVDDVARAARFYERLGFLRSRFAERQKGEAHFVLDNVGLILAPRYAATVTQSARDWPLLAYPGGVGPVQFYASAAALDAALAIAESAGATGIARVFAGDEQRAKGYFSDPDGHMWELRNYPAVSL